MGRGGGGEKRRGGKIGQVGREGGDGALTGEEHGGSVKVRRKG